MNERPFPGAGEVTANHFQRWLLPDFESKSAPFLKKALRAGGYIIVTESLNFVSSG
jgi:hypothetical protein